MDIQLVDGQHYEDQEDRSGTTLWRGLKQV